MKFALILVTAVLANCASYEAYKREVASRPVYDLRYTPIVGMPQQYNLEATSELCRAISAGKGYEAFLASAPSEKLVNGGYYLPIGVLTDPSHPQGTNVTLQEQLWRETDDAIAWALKNEGEVEVEHEQQLASAA